MSRTGRSKPRLAQEDELRPEYRFDYRKAKPNRFAGRAAEGPIVVVLDPDVSEVFRNAESVNAALRAFIKGIPPGTRRKTAGA